MSLASEVSREEIEIDELQITSAPLLAASFHVGQECDDVFKDYMGCRYATKDPRRCLEEGKKVTNCARDFLKKIKEHCNEDFTKYFTCLDYKNQEFGYCRPMQRKFDTCMLEKLDISVPERPNNVVVRGERAY